MDFNEDDKTSDFFKAFLHSLRGSCFQFVDFRDHVSIRGFLAVDVDGQKQQHYVLSEIVSRGKDSGMRSFPLEVVASSKPSDNDLTSGPERSLKHVSLSEHSATRHADKTSRVKKGLHKMRVKGRARDRDEDSAKCDSSVDRKPSNSHEFRPVRTDPVNSTFIMDQSAAHPPKRKKTVTTTNERALLPKTRISTTTVNVSSPRQRRHAIKRDGSNHETTCVRSRQLTHSIRKNIDEYPRSWSPYRKREYGSSSGTSISSNSFAMYRESGSSCEDNSAYPQNPKRTAYTQGHKGKEQKRPQIRHKVGKIKSTNKDVSEHSSSLPSNGSSQAKPYSDKCCLHQLFSHDDSDQDCSITTVQPRYLVGLNDDVNNIIISDSNNVNLLSKSPEAKLRNKLLLSNEEIIRYHVSPR